MTIGMFYERAAAALTFFFTERLGLKPTVKGDWNFDRIVPDNYFGTLPNHVLTGAASLGLEIGF